MRGLCTWGKQKGTSAIIGRIAFSASAPSQSSLPVPPAAAGWTKEVELMSTRDEVCANWCPREVIVDVAAGSHPRVS